MKQNTQYIILAFVIFIVIALIAFSFLWKPQPITDAIANKKSLQTKTTGSTDTGDVEISLTPIRTGNQLTIKMAINTHSVDLSQFNLQEIAALEANGKSIKPVSSPQLSGHHSSGDLIFNTNTNKNFKITIQGIPKLNERIFEW